MFTIKLSLAGLFIFFGIGSINAQHQMNMNMSTSDVPASNPTPNSPAPTLLQPQIPSNASSGYYRKPHPDSTKNGSENEDKADTSMIQKKTNLPPTDTGKMPPGSK